MIKRELCEEDVVSESESVLDIGGSDTGPGVDEYRCIDRRCFVSPRLLLEDTRHPGSGQ
jgi:hypothetical protein